MHSTGANPKMAGVINIGAANADDAFYRYKMPKLVAKIEGRGNGIKTNIVNNVDIAKALERNPEYVLKYFGCELGAQTNYDKSTGVSIVNGAHDSRKLLELLEGFIKKFVQCYSCGNPETHIKIKKELLHLKCKACGFVSDIDPRHKLNTFILKNPPENKMTKEEKKLKKAEEERLRDAEKAEKREKKEKEEKSKDKKKDKKDKKDKKSKVEGDDVEGGDKRPSDDVEESEEENNDDDDDDGVVWMTDTSAEAARKRAEEQLSAATAAMVTVGNIEAEEEAARKKAEKEAKRKADEEARIKAEEEAAALAAETERLALEKAAADAREEVVEKLRELIASGAKPAVVAAAVKGQSAPNLAGKVCILYDALLSTAGAGEKLSDIIKSYKPVLLALAQDAPGQLAQLIALEYFLAVRAPERCKETPLVLKIMYDEDLADEEVILAWDGKSDAAKIVGVAPNQAEPVRKAAAPFVEWLQADDDEDEESDEE